MKNKMTKDNLNENRIHIDTYYNRTNGKVIATNLWSNGVRIFKNATCIKNFNQLKEIPYTSKIPPNIDLVMPFLEDNIMDKVRIITCFENFMKGLLILNNCIVHRISDKHKPLSNKQKKTPIKILEVFTIHSFARSENPVIQSDTNENTINFSWMISPEYQNIIQLPKDILDIITEINKERNRLHFISQDKFYHGKTIIANLEILINFVEDVIKPRIKDLDDSMK